MADDGSQYPRIPVRLPTWIELGRRVAAFSTAAWAWIEEHVDPTRQPDPHEQYLLITTAAQTFAFAAYGGLSRVTPGAGADIGIAWQTVEFDSPAVTTPRGIVVDVANNTIAYTNDGVYAMAVTLAWEHNALNAGRLTNLRFFDVTDGVALDTPVIIPTGRNAEATNYSVTLLVEIAEAVKGHAIRLEIGNGDAYSLVEWDMSEWNTWNVGEWREPL